MIRVAHVITDLTTGGAETMLVRLLAATSRDRFESQVISLKQTEPVGARIRALGIPVRGLNMRGADPASVLRLAGWLRGVDVVQTWLTHANLIGGIAAALAGRIPVAWGIHVGKIDAATHGAGPALLHKLSARVSWLARRVVCCSETSRQELAAAGHPTGRMIVIPNGFDLDEYKPDPRARDEVRRELGLAGEAPLVGLVGRFHPQKDLRGFGAAAQRVTARRPDARFVLCGRGITPDNATLREWLGPALAQTHILGERRDVPRLTAAFDVACSSSSFGEAFPLVIGEAMAAGVPCAATDCGDSARMLGGLGRIVPIRDPDALGDAILALLALAPEERRRIGEASRRRVEELYSLPAIAERYCSVYEELARR